MRTALWVLAIVAVATVAAIAQGNRGNDTASDLPRPSAAFCKAAAKYDKTITAKTISVARHAELTHAIAVAAPKDAEHDANLVWHSFVKLRNGNHSVVDNGRVKAALDHVLRRAGQDCGWYRRQDNI